MLALLLNLVCEGWLSRLGFDVLLVMIRVRSPRLLKKEHKLDLEQLWAVYEQSYRDTRVTFIA